MAWQTHLKIVMLLVAIYIAGFYGGYAFVTS